MKLEDIKNLTPTESNIAKLWELFRTKQITPDQFTEVRTAWRQSQASYRNALDGDLVKDIEKVKGNELIQEANRVFENGK